MCIFIKDSDKLVHIKLTKTLKYTVSNPVPSRYRDEKLPNRPQRLCLREHQLN